jgi:hypothetical protein
MQAELAVPREIDMRQAWPMDLPYARLLSLRGSEEKPTRKL